ncbi:hypothetical protein DL95DRAFT_354443 [Leptodontidium sp. 2 PMI_412]|nr:hypothetical protein DL95DRAFT_354443 [Leptodontidium sp. 2 PMI_412]
MTLAPQEAVTHNHANYQNRLDFIEQLLRDGFGVSEPSEITPIQYDATCPFKYNNFIYRITLKTPITNNKNNPQQSLQPGCVPVPEGTTTLLLRLTNADAEGLHQSTRVENEVSMLNLATSALATIKPSIIPRVYGWSTASSPTSQGWILQEFMPGSPLDESLPSMSTAQKKNIFTQIATILKGLQDFKVPESITGFGGVTFNHEGGIVSAQMTTVGAGPWGSYEDFFRGRIHAALREADQNPYIQGWRANGIRDRLDAFVNDGLATRFDSLGCRNERVITHLDFTPNNILFDPATHNITALLDWDFSAILHPIHEFLNSFSGFGESLQGYSPSESADDASIRDAKIHGFSSVLSAQPECDSEKGSRWENLKTWEEALEYADVKRPSTMQGVEDVADVEALLGMVLPWRLSNGDALRRMDESAILKCREESEVALGKMLFYLGY